MNTATEPAADDRGACQQSMFAMSIASCVVKVSAGAYRVTNSAGVPPKLDLSARACELTLRG